jgi:hypothetical protein
VSESVREASIMRRPPLGAVEACGGGESGKSFSSSHGRVAVSF